MIDLHSHILPRLDDGAQTIDESLEMARAAADAGITVIAATPHVREDYPTSATAMEAAVADLRAAISAAGLELDVRTGGELDVERLALLSVNELQRFGLGGNPHYVLVEFPYQGWLLGLDAQLFMLRLSGLTPVLGHPERNGDVQADPERLRPLVDAGALVQLTAASVDGRFGSGPARTSATMLRAGLVHLIASDAHDARRRGFDLLGAARAVGNSALAHWLLDEVPRAIVDGTPLPAKPKGAKPRRRLALIPRRAR